MLDLSPFYWQQTVFWIPGVRFVCVCAPSLKIIGVLDYQSRGTPDWLSSPLTFDISCLKLMPVTVHTV